MSVAVHLVLAAAGVVLIVWGAESFAENLSHASVRLGVSAFALAILLAGAEPEELATAVTASLRHVPSIAIGDVIGANATICLVAFAVGAWLSPLPFTPRVRRYALAGIPCGVLAAVVSWNGHVSRAQGLLLVGAYVCFVAVIWIVERQPPTLGESGELAEAEEADASGRVGKELVLVLIGVAAMAVGASLLVEGIRRLSGVEATQTRLALTIVGFATGFELVVLAWSAARRGITEAVVAGVVGSYAYNVTMTLGAGALARPLAVQDAGHLRLPWITMLLALALVLVLARRGELRRSHTVPLLAGYAVFVVIALVA